MATTMHWYHWYKCADQVFVATVLGKVVRGGQASINGNILKKTTATQPHDCEWCTETIRIGETVLRYTVTGEDDE